MNTRNSRTIGRFGWAFLTAAPLALVGCNATEVKPDGTVISNQPTPAIPKPDEIVVRSIYLKGCELLAQGEFSTAYIEFKRVTDMAPSFAPAWLKISLIHYHREQYQAEIEALKTCVAKDDQYLEGHLNLAHALIAQERLDEALTHYLKVLGLNPRHQIANYNAALIYFDFGQFEKAKEHLERFLKEANADHPLRVKAQHYLNRCK